MVRITKRNLLLVVIIAFVAGSLLHRVYPLAGLIIMACALCFYLLCGAKRTLGALGRFSGTDSRTKWSVVLWFGVLLLAINVFRVVFTGGYVYYFLALVLFAVDFLLQQKPVKR